MEDIQPAELEVTVSESEVAVKYDGATSVVPINGQGLYEKDEAHIANGHPDVIVDLGIGFMELNQEAKLEDS